MGTTCQHGQAIGWPNLTDKRDESALLVIDMQNRLTIYCLLLTQPSGLRILRPSYRTPTNQTLDRDESIERIEHTAESLDRLSDIVVVSSLCREICLAHSRPKKQRQ